MFLILTYCVRYMFGEILFLVVEHLNIILFDLAKKYHTASKKVHINIPRVSNSGRFFW